MRIISLFIFSILLAACTSNNGNPDTILSHQQMQDILYDYHLAQSLASQNGDSVDFKTRLYAEAVFKKHNTTEEQFDNSLRYYHRRANELHKIYAPIVERLSEIAGTTAEPQYSTEGDTANIWTAKNFYILSTAEQPHLAIHLPADTILQEGDKLELTFTPQWIYKDGPRRATAILTVEYEGDTISSDIHHLSSSGPQQLNLRILPRKMKSINLYVTQNATWSELPKMLVLTQFSLIRYHNSQPGRETSPVQNNEPAPQRTFHLGKQ
jgi:hypothetical protein